MAAFDTPEPISALIELAAGEVRVVAGERTDTLVEVVPSDPFNDDDVRAAEQARIELSGGRLLVRTARASGWSLFGWGGSVQARVELPAGSRLDVRATGDVHAGGRLQETRVTTASGRIQLDHGGKLRLHTADGDITVTSASGHSEIITANGEIRVGSVDGSAVVKTSNGDISLGLISGEARLNTASGDITVERALSGVGAKTAYGSIVVGRVERGSVHLETSAGELEVGIAQGSAAWLDVESQYGSVQVALEEGDGPRAGEQSVEVRARTAYGDIRIRRA
ncbi:DUF4097 domain-containing protein [Nonomuraea sp. NBC_01738]|uniref:DUF4097 family beta strand repeat-containing protein n=1 Tax=Nonomuraea sp. NBC_01738 TaxID=2976003 RepID=UPI002E160A75|nr:DUF4097 domain-containing protein [Nonomuraea sp. NBC_01738]